MAKFLLVVLECLAGVSLALADSDSKCLVCVLNRFMKP